MKYIDEYRDARIARALLAALERKVTRPWVLMEICGGQTHTLMRYGIDTLIPSQIELVHGPGCPVCVTPLEVVEKAIQIASQPDVIFVSYGDMLRVPGSATDLLRVKASGGDVRVVFFGIGFETTAPANAMAVLQAKREGLRNFSMLVSHVLVPPAIRLLLESPANRVQGFIAPGHVCAVMGYWEYEALSKQYRVPIVVGGFEPVDLIEAILMLVTQLEEGRAEAENQYARAVTLEGNRIAQKVLREVFEVVDRKWRGIGAIPQSGFRLRPEFAEYDAERIFGLADATVEEPAECIAAQVLQGLKKPVDCPAFGVRCTPENPLGAPMVSSEGACAAYYQYRRDTVKSS
jgi:hydrogenase expression/formation protein HypD